MSHELDRLQDGSAAFVSRKLSAWHRLGTVKERIVWEEDAQKGGVLYPVAKVPNVARVPVSFGADGEPTDFVEIPCGRESYSIVRTDRMTVLGSVGENYAPLQNAAAFRPANILVDKGLAWYETLGTLRGGKQAWVLLGLNPEEIVRRAYGEHGTVDKAALEAYAAEVLPFALFANDHTGRASASVRETDIRVVCANTYRLAESKDTLNVQVQHAGNVEENYAAATNLFLNAIAARFGKSAVAAQAMKERKLSSVEFKEHVLDVAVPVAHLEAKLFAGAEADKTKWTETAIEKAYEKRNRIEALWTTGDGHTGDRSAWEAFQGYVQYLDHEAPTSDRGVALFDGGTFAKRKEAVSNRLVNLVGLAI